MHRGATRLAGILALVLGGAPALAAPTPASARAAPTPATTRPAPPATTTAAPPATTATLPAATAAPIEVTTLAPQPILYVVVRAQPAALADGLQRAFLSLLGSITTTGVDIAGPPLARYASRGTAADPTFVIEAALPVKKRPAGTLPAGLRAATLPGGPAATLVVTGPHAGLVDAHATLDAWLATAKRTPAGARWEVFLTNPMMTPDPAAQQTRVVMPLRPLRPLRPPRPATAVKPTAGARPAADPATR